MINKTLKQAIMAIYQIDQSIRQIVMDNSSFLPLAKFLYRMDQINMPFIESVINQYGWPTFDLIGKKSSHAFWLLVQHADSDLVFQKKCLKLLAKAAKSGQAHLPDVAYLTDRVLLTEGKKQRFGTHYEAKNGKWAPQPSSNPDGLAKRRKEFGLPSLTAQTKRINREAAKFLKDNPSGKKDI